MTCINAGTAPGSFIDAEQQGFAFWPQITLPKYPTGVWGCETPIAEASGKAAQPT